MREIEGEPLTTGIQLRTFGNENLGRNAAFLAGRCG